MHGHTYIKLYFLFVCRSILLFSASNSRAVPMQVARPACSKYRVHLMVILIYRFQICITRCFSFLDCSPSLQYIFVNLYFSN